jgi:deazaflavin-dependent oxidoreductase (nitroreductase family)
VILMTVSKAHTDRRERAMLRFFRMVDPMARRMIPSGVPTGAPNILLVVPGRRSGIERSTPVTMLDLDGHQYVQATYGHEGWARNLRAAGEATIVLPGGQRSRVHETELPPDEAAVVLRHALEPYHHSRFLRRMLGPHVRPPVGLQRRYHLRIDDTPEDFLDWAARHPLFELTPE